MEGTRNPPGDPFPLSLPLATDLPLKVLGSRDPGAESPLFLLLPTRHRLSGGVPYG